LAGGAGTDSTIRYVKVSTQIDDTNWKVGYSSYDNRFTSGQGYTYYLSGNVVTDAEGRTFTFDAEIKQTLIRDSNNANSGTNGTSHSLPV